jgi:ABC-type amino acid transport substrate-binding protein
MIALTKVRTLTMFAVAGLSAQVALSAPLTVFANSAQEPKAFVDAAGKVRGFAVETAEAILKDAGVEHVFVGQPFPRAFEETKACKGLMVGIFRSDERQQFLAYSAEIVPDRVALVTKAGSPFVYKKIDDLKGKPFPS